MLIEDQQRLDNMGQQISELVARAAVSCATELFSSAAVLTGLSSCPLLGRSRSASWWRVPR